ncbi:hypothetical protein [Pseudomonas sp. MWU15-20650]|uniref:hypothetical protein n=1 Tax=Pseudomonas sp. MWU15-20650 TaxID=2933107 RepID=UPI00200BB962|nr:hypothetical protein [Pseudomonas sp. MWU15-20650]
MNNAIPAHLIKLPVPPHYMRAAEQNHVRKMTHPEGRPAGDHRSAERIIEQSPIMSRFLEGRDHYEVGDDLKRQVGDWTSANPDPEARANAAYDLDKVLRFIDNVDDRTLNGSHSRNGHIDGFAEYGYGTVHNSEASLLKAFSRNGYEALRYLPT